MNARIARSVLVGLLLLGGSALAQEKSAGAQAASEELVERAVVRNRLFAFDKRFEIGANFGYLLTARLVEAYNFNASIAFNVLETLGIELRLGYAYSQNTNLAAQVARDYYAPTATKTTNDLSDMWRMGPNAVIGLRWQPIYGKINIVSEFALHFQVYAWLGGGAALMGRDSVMICNQKGTGGCAKFYGEGGALFGNDGDLTVGPLVSAALGMRFAVPRFMGRNTIKIEVRDYSFLDSYYTGVDNVAAYNPGNPTGGGKRQQAGVTNQVFIDIGYAFVF